MGTHEDEWPPDDETSPDDDAQAATRDTSSGRRGAYDAVILAGGSARRFGGADKVLLAVAGQPMLERVLAAVGDARTTVVVGPERALADSVGRSIRWTRESPAASGPLAALAAGLAFVSAPVVVVLAGDMPMVDGAVVATLVAAAGASGLAASGLAASDLAASDLDASDLDDSGAGVGDVDGAVLVDAEGRRQPLAAAYRREPLRAAMVTIGDPRDQPMRRLLGELRLVTVSDPRAALDCDTPEALAHANDLATGERTAEK